MNNSNKTFRDKLLDIEKPNPTLKDKYEREVQTMLEEKDDMAAARLGWGFIVIIAVIALVLSMLLSDRAFAIKMLVGVLIFEVAAAVGVLKATVERSEEKTREKLLEIELHLAEISEKVEKTHTKL